MRGNKALPIIVGVVILLVIGLATIYLFVLQPASDEDLALGDITPTGEFIPSDFTEIVVSSQNVPLGMRISAQDFAVELQPWPNEYLPRQYFTDLDEVNGKYARMDIPLGMPLMPNMIGAEGGMLNVTGSVASFFSPNNRVAYAIPMDTQGAVAWAIEPGDRVDVIAALAMTPIDAEFQSPYPLEYTVFPNQDDVDKEQDTIVRGSYFTGRFEDFPRGQTALIHGSSVVNNMMVQLTVQDAIVWHVGVWEKTDLDLADAAKEEATTAPEGEEDGGGGGGIMGAAASQSEPEPVIIEEQVNDVEPITLLVTREDAMLLKYLLEIGADLDLVLRPAGFKDIVIQPQPVWLRYVIDKYQLPESSDLPVIPAPIRVPLTLPPLAPPVEE